MTARNGLLMLAMALGLVLTACARVAPAPTPVAVPTLTLTPTATLTPLPSPTPSPTFTPTPTPTPTPALVQLTSGGCCVQPGWSPDSRQVLFIDKPSPQAGAGIYAVDVLTGALKPPQLAGRVGLYSQDRTWMAYLDNSRTVVEQLDSGQKWAMPHNNQVLFSPDNRRLAWQDQEDNTGPFDQRRSDVYVGNTDGTGAARVARVYGGGLVGWLPGGSKLLISGRPSLNVRERTLSWLDLATQASASLVTAERISGVSASRDGTWVAYYITFDADATRNGIWVQRTDGSPARRLDAWGAYQWRDDGRLLVIPARNPGDTAFEVWQVDAASGQVRKLTSASTTPLQILNGDWRVSPDGRWIVYVNGADRNLWRLTLPPP